MPFFTLKNSFNIKKILRIISDDFSTLFPQENNSVYLSETEKAVLIALEKIRHTDCLYHNLDHTILVIQVASLLARGIKASYPDLLSPEDYAHFIIAAAFHDIGYLKNLLPEDSPDSFISFETMPPQNIQLNNNSTDASLAEHHISRGTYYIDSLFKDNPLISEATLSQHIEMTRFPIPKNSAEHLETNSLSSLLRASDLIAQIGDPLYLKKLSNLYAEFSEIGLTFKKKITKIEDMQKQLHYFYKLEVQPYIQKAFGFLENTPQGNQWINTLQNNISYYQ